MHGDACQGGCGDSGPFAKGREQNERKTKQTPVGSGRDAPHPGLAL